MESNHGFYFITSIYCHITVPRIYCNLNNNKHTRYDKKPHRVKRKRINLHTITETYYGKEKKKQIYVKYQAKKILQIEIVKENQSLFF